MATVNDYTRTTWQTGDVIDATKMNNIETQLDAVTDNARDNGTAPVFSTTKTYAVGEHVLYNGEVYRCKTAVTSAGAWVASNWVKAYLSSDMEGEVSELKSAIHFNDFLSHNTGNEISTIDGYWVGDYGELHTSTARGYLIVPVANIYIDGVATLKSGNLYHYQTTVFSMAYLDENFHIISADYTNDHYSPKTFEESDIPNGTVYVAFNSYSGATPHVMATFAFRSTDDFIQNINRTVQSNKRKEIGNVYDKVYLTQQKAEGIIANYNLMESPANSLIQGAWANANGKFVVRTDYLCSEKLMYACPGDVITIKQTKGSTSSMYFQFYDANGSFVSASSVIYIGGGNGLVKTITVPATCYFFHFSTCHKYAEEMVVSDYDFDVYVNIKEKTTGSIMQDGGTVADVQLTASDFKQGLYNSDSRFVNTGELPSTERIGLATPVLCRAGTLVKYSMTNNEQLSVKIFEFMPGKIQTALQESSSWITGSGNYTLNYDGYLIVNVRKSGDAVIAPSDFSSTIKLPVFTYFEYINEMNERIDKVSGSGPYPYYGEKINLEAYNFKAEQIGNIGFTNYTPQSLCIYGNELFHMYTGGNSTRAYFGVYNLETNVLSGVFEMDSDTPYIHCNSACFGNKQNSTDDYPLMYVNSYMDNAVGKGVCFVEKIIKSGNDYTTEQVQKIRIDFADQEIWTGATMNPSTLAAGNWIVDTVNNRLIAYTTQGFDRTRFFLFELPELTDAEVVLSQGDILDYFDVAYIANIQDACLHNGMIYLNAGINWGDYDRILRLYVINLSGRSIVSEIHLEQIPLLNDEPEGIDYYDGSLIMSRVSKQLIKLDF